MNGTGRHARSAYGGIASASPQDPSATVLIGRGRELSEIRQALADRRPVVVVGEAGIGKTALLKASTDGWRVHLGGGLGTLASVPYLPLRRAIGALPDGDAATVARAVLERVGPDDVLAIDDLHWADDPTIEVIARLVEHVRFVGARRAGDPYTARARDTLLAARMIEVRVGPLAEADAIALARRREPSLGPVVARSIVTLAGGNPLLIEELSRGGVSTSLRRSLRHRVRGLDPATRRVLDLLAVARAPITIPRRERAINRLVDAGLAARVSGGVEIRHALIADVIVEEADPDRRRSIHRSLAGLVSEPVEAVRHLVAAGDRKAARDRAVAAAAAGVTRAQRAMLLGLAAECTDGADAPQLRVEAAETLSEAGFPLDAERLVAMVPASDDELGARRLCVLARTRWVLGDSEAALRAGEDGLRLVAGSGTEVEARLLLEHATTRLKQREARLAASFAQRALERLEARRLPVAEANRVLAVATMITDAPRSAWEPLLRASYDAARREGDVLAEIRAGEMLVSADEGSGNQLAARSLAVELIETARTNGLVEMELSVRTTLLSNVNSQGEYERVVNDGLQLLAEPMARRARAEAAGYIALALVDLGRFDDARATIDDELQRAEEGAIGRYDLTWANAELAVATGDLAQAESIADRCLVEIGSADYQDVAFMYVLRMWARLLAGRDPGDPIAYSSALDGLWQGLVPESEAIVLLHHGGGAPAHAAVEASSRFAAAADLFAPFHRRSEMRCRWAHGEALRRAGRTADARAVLESAEARAVSLGMVPMLNRIRRSLRLAGARRSAPRARSGRLSARESEVLALVAHGLTNAEIALQLGIGRPTVVRIVANASAKLGTITRAQAAIEALEAG